MRSKNVGLAVLASVFLTLMGVMFLQPAHAQSAHMQSAEFDVAATFDGLPNGGSVKVLKGIHDCADDCGIFAQEVNSVLGNEQGTWSLVIVQDQVPGEPTPIQNGVMKKVFIQAPLAGHSPFNANLVLMHDGEPFNTKAINVPACDKPAPPTTKTTKGSTTTSTTTKGSTSTTKGVTTSTTGASTTTTVTTTKSTTTTKAGEVIPTTIDTPTTIETAIQPVVSEQATLPVTGITATLAIIAALLLLAGAASLVLSKGARDWVNKKVTKEAYGPTK